MNICSKEVTSFSEILRIVEILEVAWEEKLKIPQAPHQKIRVDPLFKENNLKIGLSCPMLLWGRIYEQCLRYYSTTTTANRWSNYLKDASIKKFNRKVIEMVVENIEWHYRAIDDHLEQ